MLEELTEATVAAKPAVVAPAATVTALGTAIAALLLDRATARPPAPAAALRPTVQLSVPGPLIAFWLQLRELSTPAAESEVVVPVPTSATFSVLVGSATVSVPVRVPVFVGPN
jgi:hypothetical protein